MTHRSVVYFERFQTYKELYASGIRWKPSLRTPPPPRMGNPPIGIPPSRPPGMGNPPVVGLPPDNSPPTTGKPPVVPPCCSPPTTGNPAVEPPDGSPPTTVKPPVVLPCGAPTNGNPPTTGRLLTPGKSPPKRPVVLVWPGNSPPTTGTVPPGKSPPNKLPVVPEPGRTPWPGRGSVETTLVTGGKIGFTMPGTGDGNKVLTTLGTVPASPPSKLVLVVVVVVVVLEVPSGQVVYGNPAGVQPAMVNVVKPDEMVLVSVKVAVSVVVSWRLKPKQLIN